MEATHDKMVEREGCFAAAVAGVKAAVAAGLSRSTTNTTVYKETDMNEIGVLWAFLSELAWRLMVSPAYAYEAVNTTNPAGAERLFHDPRTTVHAKFSAAKSMLKRYRCGHAASISIFSAANASWIAPPGANPTRNVGGLRGPCYLLGDAHYKTYA